AAGWRRGAGPSCSPCPCTCRTRDRGGCRRFQIPRAGQKRCSSEKLHLSAGCGRVDLDDVGRRQEGWAALVLPVHDVFLPCALADAADAVEVAVAAHLLAWRACRGVVVDRKSTRLNSSHV